MKKLFFVSPLLILIFIFAAVIVSCDNDDSPASLSESDIELAEDDVIADEIYEEVDNEVETEVYDLDKNGYQSVSFKSATEEDLCKVVTVDHPDSTYFPKVITNDYGDGCTTVINGDTITKSGKIIVTVTDRWFIPGASRIITFQDFYVNNMKVEGTRTITNEGFNNDGHLQFHITLADGKLTVNDTMFYTRESDWTRVWVITSDPVTDTIFVTGTMSGVNFRGLDYSRETIERLTIIRCPEFLHRWKIVSGQILAIVGDNEWIIDYGDGTCNRLKQLTRTRDGATMELRVQNRKKHLRQLGQG